MNSRKKELAWIESILIFIIVAGIAMIIFL